MSAPALPKRAQKTTVAARAWIDALFCPPLVEADPSALAALVPQVRAWLKPVQAAAQDAFRVCFRLDPPPDAAPRPAYRQG